MYTARELPVITKSKKQFAKTVYIEGLHFY